MSEDKIINEDLEELKDIKIPNTKKNRDILRIGKDDPEKITYRDAILERQKRKLDLRARWIAVAGKSMNDDLMSQIDRELNSPVDFDQIDKHITKMENDPTPEWKKSRDYVVDIQKTVNEVSVRGFDFEKCAECDGMDIYIPKANHYYLEHEELLEKLIKRHEEKVVGEYMVKLSAQIASGLKGVSVLLESFHGGDWVPNILTLERIQGELVEAILMCDSNRYREELE